LSREPEVRMDKDLAPRVSRRSDPPVNDGGAVNAFRNSNRHPLLFRRDRTCQQLKRMAVFHREFVVLPRALRKYKTQELPFPAGAVFRTAHAPAAPIRAGRRSPGLCSSSEEQRRTSGGNVPMGPRSVALTCRPPERAGKLVRHSTNRPSPRYNVQSCIRSLNPCERPSSGP
jgi:hypothetical protein